MPAFVKEAHVISDSCISVLFTKYVEGHGYLDFLTYFETGAVGGWDVIKSRRQCIRLDQFLDSMVEKTLETRRVMATLQLENVLCENANARSLLRIMNSVKILDPTFVPPFINPTCSWQKKLVRTFCTDTLPTVIAGCTNDKRLEIFFNVQRVIEAEL